MFGILISALNTLLGFVFRSLIIKFFVFFALYFVVQGLLKSLLSYCQIQAISHRCLPIYQTDSGTSLT